MANMIVRGIGTLDEWVLNTWHAHFDNNKMDLLFRKYAKKLGDINIHWIILYIGMVIIGNALKKFYHQGRLLYWGACILPTFTRVLMLQISLTALLGGARPEHQLSSYWQFRKLRGRPSYTVSGHAFHGAFPFLVMSQCTNNPLLRSLCYTTSTLAGSSRLQTQSHYPSQVLLGWGLSYIGATEVIERASMIATRVCIKKSWGKLLKNIADLLV